MKLIEKLAEEYAAGIYAIRDYEWENARDHFTDGFLKAREMAAETVLDVTVSGTDHTGQPFTRNFAADIRQLGEEEA